MASTYSDLKIELIGTGEQAGSWGITTNTNLGTAIEEAIVGRATANFASDADLTLTLTDTNATQVARNYVLNVTSGVSLSTTRNLIVPTIDKPYIIENNTTGGQSIVVKTSAGSGVTVPNGKKVMVYANSTDVVAAFTSIASGVTVIGAGTLVDTTSTQTLTNKAITPRVNSTASVTSPLAWDSDDYDIYAITAQAGALTINADAGTPTNGQKIIFRIKDNGTARALTWTTGTSKSFQAVGITLPTTTVINKTTYVGCIYNAADDRWDAVATVTQA